MFHEDYPIAWLYHQNTSRWLFNVHAVPDTPGLTPPFKEYLGMPAITLPAAELPAIALQAAIEGRHSCRRYLPRPLTLAQLAALLRFAYGVCGQCYLNDVELLERPVPSGGGLYPLELYLIVMRVESVDPGVYHYAPQAHLLEQVRAIELPGRFISDLFMGQPYVAQAGVVLVMTAMLERSLWKYGDRGYRYILMESGHVAQNLNLTAAALALGSLNLGGFFDADMGALLNIDLEEEIPLYGVTIGVPAETDRGTARVPESGEERPSL
jgi:SagB-type dehydrogenase family enzyme